jgi:adenylosuccinate lyase
VLGQLTVFPKGIAAESARNLPFLATTTIMLAGVKAGAGRETAHAAIKEHALAAAANMREGREPGMVERLAGDERLGLSTSAITAILRDTDRFVGATPTQVDAFADAARATARKVKGASQVRPAKLL